MSSLQSLRALICERLTAAAEEIFTHVERTVVEYEEEVDRQRKLLEIVYKPRLKLQRIDVPQQNVCIEEEVFTEQQLCDQERNSSLDQEETESLLIKNEEEETCSSPEQEQLEKQEVSTFIVGFYNEESDHMEPEPDSDHQLLSAVAESPDQTVHMRNITVEKPHMCSICKKDFLYELSLMHHMKTHTGEKPHVCNICKECFEWKDKLENHMRAHEDLLQQNVYNEEDEVLTDLSWLYQFCNQRWNSSLDQEEPQSQPIIQEEEEICSSQEQEQLEKEEVSTFIVGFDDEENDHMQPEPDSDHQLLSPVAESQDQTGNKHVEENIVKCKEAVDNQCRLLKILWKPHVNLHRLDLTQQNFFNKKKVLTELQLCDQERNSGLDQEEPESLQIKKEEEEICSKQEQLELKQEADTFMLTPDDNEESDHMEPEPDSDHELLSPVAESPAQTVQIRNITVEKPHMCNICNKFYEHEKSLKIHKRYHTREKTHICNVCKKSFLTKSNLNNHMVVHTGEKPYTCNVCKKSYGYKTTLMYHTRNHADERPFSCGTCGKCFKQVSHLKRHKITHTCKKSYMCNICMKFYKYEKAFISHKRAHRRKNTCNICKMRFASKDAMKLHQNIHKPHVCGICNKRFKRRITLKCHERTHEGEFTAASLAAKSRDAAV